MRTALVTGALGFCARHLLKRLRAAQLLRVCGADIGEKTPPDLPVHEYFRVDVCDETGLAHCLNASKPDVIYHLAGVTDNGINSYKVNLIGSLYLLEWVRKYRPECRVLLVGTSAEYGLGSPGKLPLTEEHPCQPISPYGISKHSMVLAGQDYARNHGMKVFIARPFNVIGPGIPRRLVVGALLGRIKAALDRKDKLVIRMGNLETQRDFIDVDDAVRAYMIMAEGDYSGEVFNICSGKPYSIQSVIEIVSSFMDSPIEIEQDPALVRPSDVPVSYGTYEKARRMFGFDPAIGIEASLFRTWRYHVVGEAWRTHISFRRY